MKINFNSRTQFSGMYVISGSPEKIKNIENNIEGKFKIDYQSTASTALNQYNSIYILPKDFTPQTQLFVATNEDASPLVNFVSENCNSYNFITYPKHDAPYKQTKAHIAAAFREQPDDYLDIMLEEKKGITHDPIKEAKQFISHIAYTQDKHLSDIKSLDADSVIKAILDNCFDFVKGIVKSSIK